MKLIKIGRSKENDVVIDDDTKVSRHHAELFHDDDGNTFITDLNSANGTFVNGDKINGIHLLKDLDIIVIGKSDPIPWKNYFKNNSIKSAKSKSASSSTDNNIENDSSVEKTDYKKASKGWIIAGFIFAFLGGYFGTCIGLNYLFGKYDSKTKTIGGLMTLISLIMIGVWRLNY